MIVIVMIVVVIRIIIRRQAREAQQAGLPGSAAARRHCLGRRD